MAPVVKSVSAEGAVQLVANLTHSLTHVLTRTIAHTTVPALLDSMTRSVQSVLYPCPSVIVTPSVLGCLVRRSPLQDYFCHYCRTKQVRLVWSQIVAVAVLTGWHGVAAGVLFLLPVGARAVLLRCLLHGWDASSVFVPSLAYHLSFAFYSGYYTQYYSEYYSGFFDTHLGVKIVRRKPVKDDPVG